MEDQIKIINNLVELNNKPTAVRYQDYILLEIRIIDAITILPISSKF